MSTNPSLALTEVYTSANPQVDVVFVHGLNGHPYNTWTAENGVFWPRDILPKFVENIRVLVNGYDASVTSFSDGTSRASVHTHAENLTARLYSKRSLEKAVERPIIFVAHSLGGLVVKQCLIYSRSIDHPNSEHLRSVYVSTYAILFMGTPHLGSDQAKWGTLLQSIASATLPKKFLDSSSNLVNALTTNNETLQNTNRHFNEIMPRLRVYFFYEAKPVDIRGTRKFIVDEESAAPHVPGVEITGIERDHSHMCKFESENSPGFDIVAEAIQRYSLEAPETVAVRWTQEHQVRRFRREAENISVTPFTNYGEASQRFQIYGNQDSESYILDASATTDSGYASMNRSKPQQLYSDESTLDTRTIYSDNASLQTDQKDGFIDRFAEMLMLDLVEQVGKTGVAASVHEGLRDILAAFALRLGSESSAAEFRQAMVFVHKYRGSVQRSFETLLNVGADDEDDERRTQSHGMPLDELMNRWFDRSGDDPTNAHDLDDPYYSDEDKDPDDPVSNEVEFYAKLISRSRSYQWLLSTLCNRVLLTWDESNTCNNITSLVLSKLPTAYTVGQSVSAPIFEVEFTADWPLQEFLEEQVSLTLKKTEMGQLITLTGSLSDAQALPCSAYLQQTWPQTGSHFLHLLEQTLGNENRTAQVVCSDGAKLAARFNDDICTILVNASRDVVAEVAQLLAWTSASFRHPLFGQGIIYSIPRVYDEGIHTRSLELGRINAMSAPQRKKLSVYSQIGRRGNSTAERATAMLRRFRFDFDSERKISKDEQGRCWRKMFGTCTIVKGFPIRKRPEPNLGLEVPLNVIGGLVGTRYINEYRGKLFVKGFSAMLTPTQTFPNVVVWHLLCNDRAEHVSYEESGEELSDIRVQDLEGMRHIVGWCADIDNLTAFTARLSSVETSDLPSTRPGCILDDFSLIFGKPIIQTPSFALLNCQKSLHLSSGTFFAKFTYLVQHYALLWDAAEDRGWLTNCLDGFVHFLDSFICAYQGRLHAELLRQLNHLRLVRNSLNSKRLAASPETSQELVESIEVSETANEPESVATKETAESIFSNFTDQLFDAMDKLITYQEQVEHEDARRVGRSFKYLEGWDYSDLLGQHGTRRPRMTTMPTVSYTWIRLLRTIGTVTFFGQGFGNLLLPAKSPGEKQIYDSALHNCPSVQAGKYYVGATIPDLQRMIRSSSKHNSGHLVLGSSTVLCCKQTIFNHCRHISNVQSGRSNLPVQMPWPAKHKHLLSTELYGLPLSDVKDWKTYLNAYLRGGIIFGHDEDSGWYLDETSVPVKGIPPDPATEIEDPFDDSGLGSSRYETGSSQGRLSAVHTTSENHKPNSDSSALLTNQGHRFGNSSLKGNSSAVFGNIYNITYNNTHPATKPQTAYLDTTRIESSRAERMLSVQSSQAQTSAAKASLEKIARRFGK